MDETDWAVEAQQNLKLAENNTLIAGLEYRHAQAENIASYTGTQGITTRLSLSRTSGSSCLPGS